MKKSNVSNESQTQSCKLTAVTATEGVTIPNLLKDAGLFEVGPNNADYKNQWFWANGNYASVYPILGARWTYKTQAGSFTASIRYERTLSDNDLGFISYHFK